MRRRWIQQKDGSLVECAGTERISANADSLLWNDRLYQDANDPRFSSRSEHRKYMRAHNLVTVDDFRETWAKSQVARAEFYRSAPDASRVQDVAQAFNNPKSGLSRKNIFPRS
jgi:hypothetical protein